MKAIHLILFLIFAASNSMGQSGVTFIETTICAGDSIQLGDDYYNSDGDYYQLFSDVNGDDSLVVLTLSVVDLSVYTFFSNNNLQIEVNPPSATLSYLSCDNNFAPANAPSASNTGYFAVKATLGECKDTSQCSFYDFITIGPVCSGEVTVIGEMNIPSLPGQFNYHFYDENGLDSIIKVTLIQVYPLTSATYTADPWTIYAAVDIETVEGWYDCATQELVFSGDDQFSPTYSGSFSVSSWQACPNFSECFDFQFVGVDELSFGNKFNVFPNPFSNQLTIESETSATYVVTDLFGREVIEGQIVNGENVITIANQFGTGIYFLTLKSNGNSFVEKIIREG